MPAITTATVADGRTERKRKLEATKEELAAARFAAAEVTASAAGVRAESHPELVHRHLRRIALSVAWCGLEAAYRSDASDRRVPA